MMGTLAAAQWFAIACVVGGVVALVVRHALAKRVPSADEVSDEEAGEDVEAADETVAESIAEAEPKPDDSEGVGESEEPEA
jgi:hypothetical protein